MNPRIISLYSGSGGNAFLIADGETCILIDAGKNAKRLCEAIRSCGYAPEQIAAIFITHEHSDHISALPVFLKKHPIPVHAAEGCAARLEEQPTVAPLVVRHPLVFRETVGAMTVTSFPTPHDSRASVGYRIEIGSGEDAFRIGIATDIGMVTPQIEEGLTGCRAVILESNHDPDMLRDGSYPPDLKRRIASTRGHLSNPESAALAAKLAESGTERFLLAHLSQENNTPELALGEAVACVADERVFLSAASPEEITVLL